MNKNDLLYKFLRPVDQLISGLKGGTMLNVGDTAPDFEVKANTGKSVRLSEFLGKKVILWFYPKADTPGCTAEACGFRDLNPKLKDKNAVILGVSFDTVEENAAFAQKFRLDFPLLCDTGRDIGMKYGACKTKEDKNASRIGYVIDEKGKILQAHAKVDARAFPEQVLNTL